MGDDCHTILGTNNGVRYEVIFGVLNGLEPRVGEWKLRWASLTLPVQPRGCGESYNSARKWLAKLTKAAVVVAISPVGGLMPSITFSEKQV